MKIHALYGLEMPPAGVSGAGTVTALNNLLPNGPFQIYASNTEATTTWALQTDGWMLCSLNVGTVNYGSFRFKANVNVKDMVRDLSASSNIYIGLRMKFGTVFTGTTILGMCSDTDQANLVAVISTANLPAYAANKSYFLEVNLNYTTGMINRRVDGVVAPAIAMPAWMLTAVSATPGALLTMFSFGGIGTNYSASQGQVHTYSWRDFHCVEWESGEVAQFLGSQTVVKVPVAAVAATVWTPSTGDVSSVFKKGYANPTSPLATPTATTDAAMTAGSITYDASVIPLNTKILGVLVKGRSAVTGATTGHLGISATVGGTESADVDTTMVAAQTWYDRMLSLTKTPAGLAWTQPAIAGLTIKVKPKV
jgi:hypothetical protein